MLVCINFFGIFSAYTPLSFEMENPYKFFLFFFNNSRNVRKCVRKAGTAGKLKKTWNKSVNKRNFYIVIKNIADKLFSDEGKNDDN